MTPNRNSLMAVILPVGRATDIPHRAYAPVVSRRVGIGSRVPWAFVADHHPRPPGITRTPTGAGKTRFRYLDAAGSELSDTLVLSRVEALAIPPAWTSVWISPDPEARIQAVGVDSAGRTQYRYSPAWTQRRSGEKFAHILSFGAAMQMLRAQVADGLRGRAAPLGRDRVLDVAERLLRLGLFRVG